MPPKNLRKKKKPIEKKKTKKKPVEEEEVEEEEIDYDEEEEEEEEEEDEDDEDDTVIPTNEPEKYSQSLTKQKLELQLEIDVRKLADVERQLKIKRINLKNDEAMTGIMSEQEMLSLAAQLKLEITNLIDIMKEKFKYKDKWFLELFKKVELGLKDYEYWTIDTGKG